MVKGDPRNDPGYLRLIWNLHQLVKFHCTDGSVRVRRLLSTQGSSQHDKFFGDQDVEVMGWPDVIVPTRVGDTVLWIKSAVKPQI